MTDSDTLDIAGLIYKRWSDAFATLKAVKEEKDDGSEDWAEFHEIRFETAQADEWHWNELKSRYLAENKPIFDRMF